MKRRRRVREILDDLIWEFGISYLGKDRDGAVEACKRGQKGA